MTAPPATLAAMSRAPARCKARYEKSRCDLAAGHEGPHEAVTYQDGQRVDMTFTGGTQAPAKKGRPRRTIQPNDPNLAQLAKLAAIYHGQLRRTEDAKADLDRQLVTMKEQNYSYPLLAEIAGIAMASVQYAVAKAASK